MFALTEKVQLAQSRIVINATRAKGGVSHESEVIATTRNGETVETESKVKRHVDHATAVAKVDQATRRVISVIKKYCKHTPVGYVCPEDKIGALEGDLQGAYGDCANANLFSQAAGSERRVFPSIVYATVDWSDPSISRLVYETLAERTADQRALAESLPPGRLGEVKQELLLMATMVGGPAREALEFAARDIPKVKKAREEGKVPDYSMLDAAVSWFTV